MDAFDIDWGWLNDNPFFSAPDRKNDTVILVLAFFTSKNKFLKNLKIRCLCQISRTDFESSEKHLPRGIPLLEKVQRAKPHAPRSS